MKTMNPIHYLSLYEIVKLTTIQLKQVYSLNTIHPIRVHKRKLNQNFEICITKMWIVLGGHWDIECLEQ